MATAKKPHLAFGEWFEAQFGPEPAPGMLWQQLEDEVAAAAGALNRARARLEERVSYDAQRGAALKAWCAKP
jgi:hypothetical protein